MRVETLDWPWRWTLHPLVRAFAMSLTIHLLLFTTLEVGNRLDLWRFSPLVLLAKALKLDAAKLSPAKIKEAMLAARQQPEQPEVPLLFVDVDPSQAAPEPPPPTKYYSAVSSVAANPEPKRDTKTPKLEGRQDKVLKTMDSAKAAPAAHPLVPAPKVEPPEPRPEPEPVKPPPPAPAPTPSPPPGDLAVGKPAIVPEVSPAPPAAETPPPRRERPRTLAAATVQKQINSQSALAGEKMQQEGGVRRFSIQSSLDVQASPLGSYDAKFVAVVQQCWYGLLDAQRYSLDRMGKVVLDFRLTYDGRITDMKVADSNVGDIYTTICQLAVTKPAPFEKWPTDLRRLIGANYREVRFTFYY